MSRKKKRISTSEGDELTQSPFEELELNGLPSGPEGSVNCDLPSKREKKNRDRGRVDIIRQTAHRGGKSVMVITNFPPIELLEKKELAKKMQKACSVGGTVKDGNIEIQGENREEVKRILLEAGFKPIFAGG
ncbi:MAG: translation initiation factor [Verrucomicrobiales bacterium]|nr:translation initiation factor [Verrucomicrobiales bacterium]